MYYVTKANGKVEIWGLVPETEYFEIEEIPECSYTEDGEHLIELKADFDKKVVWWDVKYLQKESQLDEIEKGIEGIDSNTLTIMEGIASSYEAEQSNALILMEGIASLYEAQISEGAK